MLLQEKPLAFRLETRYRAAHAGQPEMFLHLFRAENFWTLRSPVQELLSDVGKKSEHSFFRWKFGTEVPKICLAPMVLAAVNFFLEYSPSTQSSLMGKIALPFPPYLPCLLPTLWKVLWVRIRYSFVTFNVSVIHLPVIASFFTLPPWNSYPYILAF